MELSDDKTENWQISGESRQNLKSINYCIPGILSTCSAGISWTEHRICKFAVKLDHANKCMYFIESLDGHCDCPEAQKDAVSMRPSNTDHLLC